MSEGGENVSVVTKPTTEGGNSSFSANGTGEKTNSRVSEWPKRLTDKQILHQSLEPENVESYTKRALGSEDIKNATARLEQINQERQAGFEQPEPNKFQEAIAQAPKVAEAPTVQAISEAALKASGSKNGSEPQPKPAENGAANVAKEIESPQAEQPAPEPNGKKETAEPSTEKTTEMAKKETEEIRKEVVIKIKEYLDKELEDKSKNTKDWNEKAIYDGLRKRWSEEGKSEDDFRVVTEGNPEQLMRELLRDTVVYGKRIYTDEEIDNLLREKGEGSFYKKMELDVVSQVLQRKILEGGLTEEEVSAIEKTPWVQNLVEAQVKYDMFKKHVEKIVGEKSHKESDHQDKPHKENLVKKVMEKIKKNPWLLVLLLFGPLPISLPFVMSALKDEGGGH